MKWKRAEICLVLALGCVAADGVAPTQSELAALYRKAAAEAAVHHETAALEELAKLDARQPDLPAVENLRGVIFLRQGAYEQAAKAFGRALEIDPQFQAARFNLADIPFQKKAWTEARNHLQKLLEDLAQPAREELGPLIEYKILLTVLFAKQEEQVGALLSQLKEWQQSPAFTFAEAAIAFQHDRRAAGRGWVDAAAKKFRATENGPFLESFYEIGWLPRPPGEPIAAAEFSAPEEQLARSRAEAQAAIERAKRAVQARDFDLALKSLGSVEERSAPEPAFSELRAEILLEKKRFEEASAALQQAAAADPASWRTKYLGARIAFAQKDYAAAQAQANALLRANPNGLQPEAAALVRYQLFLSLLAMGKESTAQQTLEQFKFTDPTPAFYYAQAAWNFRFHNAKQARTWIATADQLFAPASTAAFRNPLADLGWLNAAPEGEAIAATIPTASPSPSLVAVRSPVATPSPAVVADDSPTPSPTASPGQPVESRSKKPSSPAPPKAASSADPKQKRHSHSARSTAAKGKSKRDQVEIRRALPVIPAATPRPFLDRMARTLLSPFKVSGHQRDQEPPAGRASPSPAGSEAAPARRHSN